ncbi:MAG: radical SAM family heme chaperone HemW [Tissierellia bacterium]|nr:radical SAM family heme chaperone HemW [Tissierellia bacterium]
MKNIGIYIHIPFCKKKCYYCDFTAFQNLEDWMEDYFENLIKEIKLNDLYKYEIDSIYIGGGTPSYVDGKYLREIFKILRRYKVKKDAEITIEVNPESLDIKKLKLYRRLGINRISMGVQSFNDKILKDIGRSHTKEDIFKAFDLLKEVGFKNISIDMILNLPNQTLDDIKFDLSCIDKLDITHISWYSLILEKKSYFNTLYKKNKLELMDEDYERDVFNYIVKELEKRDYLRYEISNFSKDGYESRHNLKYWNCENYLGFGLSAASFIDSVRTENTGNFSVYKNKIKNNKKPIVNKEFLNKEDLMIEYIIMKLRTTEGIRIRDFRSRFKEELLVRFFLPFRKYDDLGFFNIENGYVAFSQKGFDLSNSFFREII